MYIESEYLELKEIINADFKKEIVAFANTSGGEIYVGVTRDGKPVGVNNAEAEMERISSMIRDGIKPDLTSYTTIERVQDAGVTLIKVTVSRGERRPYHLTDKGLKPSGVYVRHGVASVPASDDMIRQMLRESDGTTYDRARSTNQELTFAYAEAYFQKCGLSFTQSNQRTMKLLTADGYYTNAAMLLSDQCEHSIKCAVYAGVGKTNFQTRRAFSGSILQQVEEAYAFLSLNNKIRSAFDGLHRVDVHDYPVYAIREALLNAVVHRDYDFSGSTIINLYDDRMEFVSLGGLVKGLTLTDVMAGVSQSRNTVIADIFYRLELIESYGTGIQRIIESYQPYHVQPTFQPAPASFVVMLPNVNYHAAQEKETHPETADESERVLAYLTTAGEATRKDVEHLLNTSSFPANKVLTQLMQDGKVIRVGAGRATRYRVNKGISE